MLHVKEAMATLDQTKSYTLKEIKRALTQWYLKNAQSIPAHLTIRDFFELCEEKGWLKEQPDGTYRATT